MNILITAIGSMSAQSVIASLRNNYDCFIVGCDTNEKDWLIAARETDFFYKIVEASDKQFIEQVIMICEKHDIHYIIPLTDPEIDYLSVNQFLIENQNRKICISENKTINICRDKYLLHQYFIDDKQINVIPTYLNVHANRLLAYETLIAKPRKGRSSKGQIKYNNPDECNFDNRKFKNYIFQPFLDGNLFTVDVIRDQESRVCAIGREELVRTPHGAGTTVKVSDYRELSELCTNIATKLKITGVSNFEFILHKGTYYLMDVNPRFSAGVGFSIMAGYDIVNSMMEFYLGNTPAQMKSLRHGIYSKVCGEQFLNPS